MFNVITNYFTSVREELKKVSWPTKEDTVQKTVLVIVISLVVAVYLGLIDYVLNLILQLFI